MRSGPPRAPFPPSRLLVRRREREVHLPALDRHAGDDYSDGVAHPEGPSRPPAAPQGLRLDVVVVVIAEAADVDEPFHEHLAELDEEAEGHDAAHEAVVCLA